MYGKIFKSTFTGSMAGAGMNVFAVWAYVIANVNKDSSVELNPVVIAGVMGGKADDVKQAIEYLCAKDPNSRTEAEGGRRLIQEGPFIFRMVNHKKYAGMRNEDERRDYQRTWVAGKRRQALKKTVDKKSTNVDSRPIYAVDIDIDIDKNKDNSNGLQPTANQKADWLPSAEDLFPTEAKSTPLQKTKPKPKKENPPKDQPKCNAIGVWMRKCKNILGFDGTALDGFEIKKLSELGRMYDEDTFIAMMKAYRKYLEEDFSKSPDVWEFYKRKHRWNKAAYKYREVIDPNSEAALNALAGGAQ